MSEKFCNFVDNSNIRDEIMKQYFIILALLSLLVSCSSSNDDSIQFGVATADKTVKLASNESSPSCSVHLEIAYALESNGHKAEIINNLIEKRLFNQTDLPMQQATDSFADEYTANYEKTLLPLYNQDQGNDKKVAWYDYHYIVKTATEQGRPGALVYHIYMDYYEGGAHSVDLHLVMNFEESTGRQLMLSDIFVPGYEDTLSALLQQALCEHVDAENLAGLRAKGYLHGMDMYPTDNFILGEETITFIYNTDDIAPYDKGTIELTLAYTALDKILNKSPKHVPADQ